MVMLKGVFSAETRGINIHIDDVLFISLCKQKLNPASSPDGYFKKKFSWWASELIAVSYGAPFIYLSSILDTVA